MAKLPFKTWTQKDADKLKQLVKDFNRKRREFESPVTPQPPKITYGELKKAISSRAEYNRVMGVYGRYLKQVQNVPIKIIMGCVLHNGNERKLSMLIDA